MYYVNQRWLGGLLTNMTTVQKSIKRLKELEAMAAEGNWDGRAKKEIVRLERERKHLIQNLAGIKDMNGPARHAVRDRFEQRSDRRRRKPASWAFRWWPWSTPTAIRTKWTT